MERESNFSHVDFRMKENPFRKERFLIVESYIGFDFADFAIRIRDQMEFIGMEPKAVAKACYIDYERFKKCLNCKQQFTPKDIIVIREQLNLY
jgi:hypothetical protein